MPKVEGVRSSRRGRAGTAISLPIATDPIVSDQTDNDPANLRGALGVPPDESIVLTLSRLVPGKRVDLVLDMIELARTDDCTARFVICGDGPEFGPLVAEAQRRELDGWVHFLRHVPDPGRLLLESDVVLNASDSEGGMPFALVEAQSRDARCSDRSRWGGRSPRRSSRWPTGAEGRCPGALRCSLRRIGRGSKSDRASCASRTPLRS